MTDLEKEFHSEKKQLSLRDGEKFLSAWEGMYKNLHRRDAKIDIKKFKHLIFDTYHYFWKFKQYNSVPREDLEIYKYIAKFAMQVGDYPDNCTHYEYYCCIDFAEGLCHAIEDGFTGGYHSVCLPLGLSYHVPAGCAAPEADMSSYEAYEKCFRREMVDFMREHIEDDELDEKEELQKIAAIKDNWEDGVI